MKALYSWKRIIAIVTAAIIGFASLVGAVEWFAISQRDGNTWHLAYQEAEPPLEVETGKHSIGEVK